MEHSNSVVLVRYCCTNRNFDARYTETKLLFSDFEHLFLVVLYTKMLMMCVKKRMLSILFNFGCLAINGQLSLYKNKTQSQSGEWELGGEAPCAHAEHLERNSW